MKVLYLYSTFATSLLLGLIFYHLKLINESRKSNFLIGFSCTPFMQFVWTLLLVLIFHGGVSRWVYILPPPIFVTAALIYCCFKPRKCGRRFVWEEVKRSFESPLNHILLVAFVVAMTFWIWYCGRLSSSATFIRSDTMEYFYKASYFANSRELTSLSYVNGLPDGSAVADHHFPSYTAFLAYAFMHTSEEIIGFPHHDAPLFACFFFMLFMISAMMGLYCVFDDHGLHFLGLPVILWTVTPFCIDIYNSPRDVFRICAFCVFLSFIIEYRNAERKRLRDFIVLAVVSFIGASAHVLNFVLVILSILAYVVFLLWKYFAKKLSSKKMRYHIIAVFSLLAGAVLSFAGNIFNYVSSGKWSAVRMVYSKYSFYPDYLAFISKGKEPITFLQKIEKLLFFDQSYFGLILIACFLFALVVLIFTKKQMSEKEVFLLLVLLCIGLPETGVLDNAKWYEFSYYFAKIPRYGLPFLIMVLFYCWLFIWKHLLYGIEYNDIKYVDIVKITMVLFFCAVIVYYDYKNMSYTTYLVGRETKNYKTGNQMIYDNYGQLMSCLKDYNGRILVQQQIGYILGKRAMVYTSYVAEPIYSVVEESEIIEKFKSLGIEAVVLPENSNKSVVSVFPWYNYVQTLHKVVVNGYEVYFLE